MNSFSNEYDTIEKLIYEEGLKINALHFHPDLDLMLIVLSNKKVLQWAISSSLRLGQATLEQLHNYRLIGKGAGVHWPDLDEDLSLKGFLKEEIDRSLREIKSARIV
ncbi:DUF2442 domain-containing protein [Anditalea andensis]|uniref:DUF2442 domain-containing protein n=1 Tax=Anditalea andensis TaxID=1048983 RepID=A0A074KW60_9BACT|nr:DUF2442 domain-containing protein [Anditalea andensis]KEO71858.1 hypothetical protein EL17_20265 [Anditalea andensis]